MTNADICIQRSLEANPLREPVLRSAIQALALPLASSGLDAGCGIGLPALLLAEAVGPAGHVTGVDIATELLEFGNGSARHSGYSDRINFCAGDVGRLPVADNAFDWAWSADCIGYPVGELTPFLNELMRVVRPGGSIILLGWSAQQLLPGYPFLEARLNATCSGFLPYVNEKNPELNFLRALHSFQKVGLKEAKAQTFVGDVQAPLDRNERAALLSLFEMLWGQPQPDVSPRDWKEYKRLCDPGSPDFVLATQDYYAFFTYSVFWGKVPRA